MQIKPVYTRYQELSANKNKEPEQAAAVQRTSGQLHSAPEESASTWMAEDGEGVILELSAEKKEEERELTEREKERMAASDAMREMAASMRESMKDKKAQASKQSPEDKSGLLTRRLVAAISQLEIQQIISEASQNLASARMAAAMGDDDTAKAAKAIVRKLEKLIRRSQKKASDLNEEDGMRREQARAEQQQKEQRAEQIKKELREHIRKRKEREKKYLREEEEQRVNTPTNFRLDAATEAKIEQQAQMQAAIEMAAHTADAGGDLGAVAGAPSGAAGENGASGAAEGGSGGAEGGEIS